jgi:hypothetical protein
VAQTIQKVSSMPHDQDALSFLKLQAFAVRWLKVWLVKKPATNSVSVCSLQEIRGKAAEN